MKNKLILTLLIISIIFISGCVKQCELTPSDCDKFDFNISEEKVSCTNRQINYKIISRDYMLNVDSCSCEYADFTLYTNVPVECCTDSDCLSGGICSNNKCDYLICDYCQYVENHQCKNYGCCSDSDCDDDNEYTEDICISAKSKDSYCVNEEIESYKDDIDLGDVNGQIEFIASNDPSDYQGDIIFGYTRPSNWKDYQPLKSTVNSIINGKTNDYDKMVVIANWVKNSRPYGGYSCANSHETVIDIFNADTGVCLDAAILTTAMMRLADIPARAISPPHIMHEYTEVYVDGRWIGIDSTFGEGNASIFDPVTSITFTKDELIQTLPPYTPGEITFIDGSIFKSSIVEREGYRTLIYPFIYKRIYYSPENPVDFSFDGFSEKYNGADYLTCVLEYDSMNCDWYYCFDEEADNNFRRLWNPGLDFAGYDEDSGYRGFPYVPDKSYYAKVKLPPAIYKVRCGYNLVSEDDTFVTYSIADLTNNEEVMVTPSDFQKTDGKNDDVFNMVVSELTKDLE